MDPVCSLIHAPLGFRLDPPRSASSSFPPLQCSTNKFPQMTDSFQPTWIHLVSLCLSGGPPDQSALIRARFNICFHYSSFLFSQLWIQPLKRNLKVGRFWLSWCNNSNFMSERFLWRENDPDLIIPLEKW